MDRCLLLGGPFEADVGIVCVWFHLDFRDESPALFATLDGVLWLSPAVCVPTDADLRIPPCCLVSHSIVVEHFITHAQGGQVHKELPSHQGVAGALQRPPSE